MLNFTIEMRPSEHSAKACELVELFKAWGIEPGDALAIARHMVSQIRTATSWEDPLKGTGRKADPWRS